MKNKAYITVAAVAFALVASPAFAETSSSGEFKKDRAEVRDMRNKIVDERQDRLDSIKENRAEVGAKLDAKKSEMIALEEKLKSASTQAEKEAIKKEIEAKRGEFKSEIKDMRQENKDEIKAKTTDIRSLRSEALAKVYSAFIVRLEKLSTRLESRIEKVASSGRDVTEAKAALSVANTEIAAARDAYAKLPDFSDKSRKDAVVALKGHLKSAHEALVKALGLVKGLGAPSTSNQ